MRFRRRRGGRRERERPPHHTQPESAAGGGQSARPHPTARNRAGRARGTASRPTERDAPDASYQCETGQGDAPLGVERTDPGWLAAVEALLRGHGYETRILRSLVALYPTERARLYDRGHLSRYSGRERSGELRDLYSLLVAVVYELDGIEGRVSVERLARTLAGRAGCYRTLDPGDPIGKLGPDVRLQWRERRRIRAAIRVLGSGRTVDVATLRQWFGAARDRAAVLVGGSTRPSPDDGCRRLLAWQSLNAYDTDRTLLDAVWATVPCIVRTTTRFDPAHRSSRAGYRIDRLRGRQSDWTDTRLRTQWRSRPGLLVVSGVVPDWTAPGQSRVTLEDPTDGGACVVTLAQLRRSVAADSLAWLDTHPSRPSTALSLVD